MLLHITCIGILSQFYCNHYFSEYEEFERLNQTRLLFIDTTFESTNELCCQQACSRNNLCKACSFANKTRICSLSFKAHALNYAQQSNVILENVFLKKSVKCELVAYYSSQTQCQGKFLVVDSQPFRVFVYHLLVLIVASICS